MSGTDPSVPAPSAVHAVGREAILADYPDTATALAAAAAVRALDPVELIELVPAERTLLLVGATARDAAALERLLDRLPRAPQERADAAVHTVPVVYDGEDLDEVAALLDMSTQALVTTHTSTRWTVAFGGFAPGFAYLLPEPEGGQSGAGRSGDGQSGAGSESDGSAESFGAHTPARESAAHPPWEVPRRTEPRSRVPAGAVALASRYSAIYPRPSPGGWQLIGRTDTVLFDPERTPPALLMPGDEVQFEARRPSVRAGAAGSPLARAGRRMSTLPESLASAVPDSLAGAVPETLVRRRPRAAADSSETPALEVLSPGSLTLVQDAGRPGHAHIGVPASGAFDRGALARVNLAVGNPIHAAALEVLIGPIQLRALASTVVAVSGAPAPVSVRRHDRDSADVHLGAEASAQVAIALDPGDLLELGPVSAGLRMILAVRGGIRRVHPVDSSSAAGGSTAGTPAARTSAAGPVLGSLSRDTLSDLGPPPLEAGDMLLTGPHRGLDAVPAAQTPATDAALGSAADPTDGAANSDAAEVEEPGAGVVDIDASELSPEPSAPPLVVPLSLGPREDLLGPDAVAALLGTTWTVRADSDRVGLRVDGDPLPVPDGSAELPSEAMVVGAIQVPPSGLPVIFGPDHPTTGGYPVIGVVGPVGMEQLAQAAPGTRLRFRRSG